MELTIPMGQKDHSKKVVEMVKGCEELYAEPKNYWSRLKNSMKKFQQNTKVDGVWGWATHVAKHLGFKHVWWISPTFHHLVCGALWKFT